jgi:hypothetical protein
LPLSLFISWHSFSSLFVNSRFFLWSAQSKPYEANQPTLLVHCNLMRVPLNLASLKFCRNPPTSPCSKKRIISVTVPLLQYFGLPLFVCVGCTPVEPGLRKRWPAGAAVPAAWAAGPPPPPPPAVGPGRRSSSRPSPPPSGISRKVSCADSQKKSQRAY